MQEFCRLAKKANNEAFIYKKKLQAYENQFERFYEGTQLANIHPVGTSVSATEIRKMCFSRRLP